MVKLENWRSGFDTLGAVAAKAPLLTAEEEAHLARAAQAGGKPEVDALVRSHLRLVLSIASQFRCRGVELDDLVSEGLLGLIHAVDRFDPDRGVRLATYAAWWIRAHVRRFTISNRRIVRPPSTRHARKILSNLRTTQRELEQRTGAAPDSTDIANALGVEAREVEEMDDILRRRDISWGIDRDGTTHETACTRPSPEAAVASLEERRQAASVIHTAMTTLTERERCVLTQRTLSPSPTLLADLGRSLGVSGERIRQIEGSGYQKLKAAVLSAVA